MKKSELTAAAKELNKVLGLEPPIDVTQEIAKVRKLVKEAGTLIEPTDSFSVGTTKVLEELKVVVPAPAAKKAAAPVAKALDEPVNDDEGAEELEVVIEEPSPEAKAKSKAKAAPKKAEKAPKAKKEKSERTAARPLVVARVLRKHAGSTITTDTSVDEANATYSGSASVVETMHYLRAQMSVLQEFGIASFSEDNTSITINKVK